jgi:hypothetical protein
MSKITSTDRGITFLFALFIGLSAGTAANAFNPQPDPPGKVLQGRVLPGETKVLKEVDPGPAKGQLSRGETKFFKEVDPAPAKGQLSPGETKFFKEVDPAPAKGSGQQSNLIGTGGGASGKLHVDKKTKPQPTPPCDPLKDGMVLEQFSWEAEGDLRAQKAGAKGVGPDFTAGKTANLTTMGQPQLGALNQGLNVQVNVVPGIVIPTTQSNTMTPQFTPPAVTGGAIGRTGR